MIAAWPLLFLTSVLPSRLNIEIDAPNKISLTIPFLVEENAPSFLAKAKPQQSSYEDIDDPYNVRDSYPPSQDSYLNFLPKHLRLLYNLIRIRPYYIENYPENDNQNDIIDMLLDRRCDQDSSDELCDQPSLKVHRRFLNKLQTGPYLKPFGEYGDVQYPTHERDYRNDYYEYRPFPKPLQDQHYSDCADFDEDSQFNKRSEPRDHQYIKRPKEMYENNYHFHLQPFYAQHNHYDFLPYDKRSYKKYTEYPLEHLIEDDDTDLTLRNKQQQDSFYTAPKIRSKSSIQVYCTDYGDCKLGNE